MRECDRFKLYRANDSVADAAKDGCLGQFSFVLLTCVDSMREIAPSLTGKKILLEIEGSEALDGGIVLPGKHCELAARSINIFNGFDEVWCFNRRPKHAPPISSGIVSPFDVDVDGLDSALLTWMVAENCLLGLGDGIGLNIVEHALLHWRRHR